MAGWNSVTDASKPTVRGPQDHAGVPGDRCIRIGDAATAVDVVLGKLGEVHN